MAQDRSDKLAVVLIHGIGEPRPMANLHTFVKAVWTTNDKVKHKHAKPGLWSKPLELSVDYELRRLTTSKTAWDTRIDFFEFYWAHLMPRASMAQLIGWLRMLVLRDPRKLHPTLILGWVLVMTAFAIAIFVTVKNAIPQFRQDDTHALVSVASILVTAGILPLVYGYLRSGVGDAARYLNPAPENIQARHAIRSAGIDLLRKLHERGYGRIVVMGYSLGSMIGYDLMTHAFPELVKPDDLTADKTKALDALEAAATAETPISDEEFQRLQRAYAAELAEAGATWRVTDFVTVGCPLVFARELMARNATEFDEKVESREFPVCPPQLETSTQAGKEIRRFSYRRGANGSVPHHAAVFGPTRWTNLYFPIRWMVLGDPLAGPLKPLFGKGVRDMPLSEVKNAPPFGHTRYWTVPKQGTGASPQTVSRHIKGLRDALHFDDKGLLADKGQPRDESGRRRAPVHSSGLNHPTPGPSG